ncbi:MAG: hypothetical protein HYZ69_01290 [Candidatus Colwellbacteria bacterium]|nr:hypothetical protein [Candidatus Colwellbacteria bacterium]
MSIQKPKQNEYFIRLDRLQEREALRCSVSNTFREVALFYGFSQISSSFFDAYRAYTPLVKASFLDETPLVGCMFQGGENVVVRPSGVLGAVRAFALHNAWDPSQSQQIFFEGESYFGTEKKTSSLARFSSKTAPHILGRHEMGLVILGEEGFTAEAQIIQVIAKTLERFGIKNDSIELHINATGCSECHPRFLSEFLAYFKTRSSRLCKDCKHHVKRTPTKILLCQEERCHILAGHAPSVLDFLCDSCKKHLKGILEFLDEMEVPYYLDHSLFRPGSWLSSFIFEFFMHKGDVSKQEEEKREKTEDHYGEEDAKPHTAYEEKHESDNAAYVPLHRAGRGIRFAEGGRLTRAAEMLFGRKVETACGVLVFENLEKVLPHSLAEIKEEKQQVFLAQLGELAKRKSLGILEELRLAGIDVAGMLARNSIKSQLRAAERENIPITLVLGQKEALDETIIVREMESGIQETIPQGKLVEFLKRKLKK